MTTHIPTSGTLPVDRRGFDNVNMATFSYLMVDRYRYNVSDLSVSSSKLDEQELRSELLEAFSAGVRKDAFLLVDSIRTRATIESVTYVLPSGPEQQWIRVRRCGRFQLSEVSDPAARQEAWDILLQCMKGRGSGHRLHLASAPGPKVAFGPDELAMLAG